jgi:hypothetical protein
MEQLYNKVNFNGKGWRDGEKRREILNGESRFLLAVEPGIVLRKLPLNFMKIYLIFPLFAAAMRFLILLHTPLLQKSKNRWDSSCIAF